MKTSKKQRKFSSEQTAYLLTKAHYDELQEAATAIIGECAAETDEEIEAYCEREAQVHTELGTLQARQALHNAEQALLTWGIAQVKITGQAKPAELQMIERLITTPLLKYRQRAIDLTMRLEGGA